MSAILLSVEQFFVYNLWMCRRSREFAYFAKCKALVIRFPLKLANKNVNMSFYKVMPMYENFALWSLQFHCKHTVFMMSALLYLLCAHDDLHEYNFLSIMFMTDIRSFYNYSRLFTNQYVDDFVLVHQSYESTDQLLWKPWILTGYG